VLHSCPPNAEELQAQDFSREEAIVELAGGASTTTASPHFEKVVVTLVPLESLEVSRAGRDPPWEMVKEFDRVGEELVAAVFHLRTYELVPPVRAVETFVPLALGRTAVTEETVTLETRSEYWLVPFR
jgi:hypothetical protein